MSSIEIPPGARTAPEPKVVPQPVVLVSTSCGYQPSAEKLAEWEARALRLSPFGAARQLVVALEIEIWATDERSLGQRVREALDAYLERGQAIENGAEVVLPGNVAIRHRFLNRYFSAGRLHAVEPPEDSRPPDVAQNDPRLQA